MPDPIPLVKKRKPILTPSQEVWGMIATLIAQVKQEQIVPANATADLLISLLQRVGMGDEATLIESACQEAETAAAAEHERTYVCTITIDPKTGYCVYGFWEQFLTDGNICAGCGGFNDYGYGGYMDEVCWECKGVRDRLLHAFRNPPPQES